MAFAEIELGLTEEQFWRLTPAKFWALRQARNEQTKRRDYRAGIVTRTIRQALGAKSAKWWDDFPQHKERPDVGKLEKAKAAWAEHKKHKG